jgi:hypothetical protein
MVLGMVLVTIVRTARPVVVVFFIQMNGVFVAHRRSSGRVSLFILYLGRVLDGKQKPWCRVASSITGLRKVHRFDRYTIPQ